jgi:hypothetical protein
MNWGFAFYSALFAQNNASDPENWLQIVINRRNNVGEFEDMPIFAFQNHFMK